MTNDKRARRVQWALMLMQGSEARDEWAFNEGVRVGVRVGVCAVLRKVQTRYIQRQPRPSARLGDNPRRRQRSMLLRDRIGL